MPQWVPPLDLYETESEVVLEIDLAGVSSSDVQVRYTTRSVVLTGTRGDRIEPSATAFHVIEIERGQFSREVELPVPIEPGSAHATFNDGLLVIRLCKRPAAVHGCTRAHNREGLE